MAILLAIALGLGLATAAGLRVFLPLFGAGLGAHFGYIELNPGFSWLGGTTALIALGTAAAAEVLAYYVPWLDHALDVIATPAAVGAGILASAATVLLAVALQLPVDRLLGATNRLAWLAVAIVVVQFMWMLPTMIVGWMEPDPPRRG